MSIAIRVRQVQKVFGQLEEENKAFQKVSGLACLSGCGHCCNKADIEAAVLEFLPYAFHLFLEGQHELAKQQIQANTTGLCHGFKPIIANSPYLKGRCTIYEDRGLICRLFGFATIRDKNGDRQLSTCKWIKGSQADTLNASQALIQKGRAPHYMSYYQKLAQIDFRLGQEYLPINKAILRAIEEVENYYQYRPFPYRLRKSA